MTFLKNGEDITISGRLTIRGYGWRRFLVIETNSPYKLDFDAEDGGPTIAREIAFYLAGQTEVVEKMRRQEVTVTGKLQLNPWSPYYWQGTMLQARNLRLKLGKILTATKENQFDSPWPDGPKTFAVAITMFPNKLLPQYALLPKLNRNATVPLGFGCGVNGGGDLLNCSCPTGYVGSQTGKVENGQFVPLGTSEILQLEIGEDDTHSITVAAECTRSEMKR
ncbi:MAG TPA: hypothetical protein VK578_03110 [Edaphobacter sp.]|nr:hypothetical protein [Edaphobacter sp.]